jgi:hypothetical protein
LCFFSSRLIANAPENQKKMKKDQRRAHKLLLLAVANVVCYAAIKRARTGCLMLENMLEESAERHQGII